MDTDNTDNTDNVLENEYPPYPKSKKFPPKPKKFPKPKQTKMYYFRVIKIKLRCLIKKTTKKIIKVWNDFFECL